MGVRKSQQPLLGAKAPVQYVIEPLEDRTLLSAIVSGETQFGSIDKGETVIYTFTATAGQSFVASVGAADQASTYHPKLLIYDPTGKYIGQVNPFNDIAHSSFAQFAASTLAGNYTIIVEGANPSNLGTYDLELDAAPSAQVADAEGDGGVSIVSGQTRNGAINHPGDLDVYTFTATAGQSFEVSVGAADQASTYHPRMLIYDPTGKYLSGVNPFNDVDHTSFQGYVNTALAGDYTIVVQGANASNTGTYALELDAALATQAPDSGGDGGLFIVSGQTRAGTINHPGDIDVYTYTATAGQTFEASVGVTDQDSTFHPEVHVYDPNGHYIGASLPFNDTPHTSYQPLVNNALAGVYTIIVQGANPSNVGAYDIELAAAQSTQATDSDHDGGSIYSGQTLAGAISRPGDLDVFTFYASETDTVTLKMTATDAGTLFGPEFLVYGPGGTGVAEGFGSSSEPASVTFNVALQKGGRYVVIAQGNSSSTTGAYTFHIEGNVLLAMANLSADVYSDPAARQGYPAEKFRPIADDDDPHNLGYAAEAYEDSGNDQIVIAFRGTVPKFNDELLKTLVADESFLVGNPTPLFVQQVADAALFIISVHQAFPTHPILLTGHSLGGAVAQLAGFASKYMTRTFNAPGSKNLYADLTSYLSPINNLGTDFTNKNYRLYGDQVSLAGIPIGSTVPLANPDEDTLSTAYSGTIKNVMINLGTILDLHSIKTVIHQISLNAAFKTSDVNEPNDAPALENAVGAKAVLKSFDDDNALYLLSALITSDAALEGELLDPPAGTDFVLTGDNASPAFTSIILPAFSGTASYQVRYKTAAATWSSFQTVAPGATFSLSASSHSIEFIPLDQVNQATKIDQPFFIVATFASAGMFNGYVTTDPSFTLPPWLSLGADACASFAGNTLTVLNGTLTLTADAALAMPGLNIVATGNASIVLNTTQHLGWLTLDDDATVTLAAGGGKVLRMTSLSIAHNAKLDLNDNDLILDYDSALPPQSPAIAALIQSARAGGNWTGTSGITSSAAKAAHNTTLGAMEAADYKLLNGSAASFDNEPLDSSAVVVRYTLGGDVNLDRAVGFADLVTIAQNYGLAAGATRAKGDLNGDGSVGFADLVMLAQQYGTTLPTPAPAARPVAGPLPLVKPKQQPFSTAPIIKPQPAARLTRR